MMQPPPKTSDSAPRAHFLYKVCVTAQEMRVGPSEPACRSRSQTTLSCSGKEPLWLALREKASLKGSGKDQGDERKRTIDEVSKSGDDVKTGDSSRSSGGAWKIPAYCPGGVRHKDGMNLIQAFARNVGTCRFDVKGKPQVEDPQEGKY